MDKRGRRHSNDARKLYTKLKAAERTRQVIEYLDDKKFDQTKGNQSTWLPGTRTPWHIFMRRAFKEKLRHFTRCMQPTRATNPDCDPFRHKCARVLVAEACSSIVQLTIVSKVHC